MIIRDKNRNIETYSESLYLENTNQGLIRLFDLLPEQVKQWNKGSVSWCFETSLDEFSSVQAEQEIGQLEFVFYSQVNSFFSQEEQKLCVHIMSRINGFIRFESTIRIKHYGSLDMSDNSYLEEHQNDTFINPYLFSFSSDIKGMIARNITYSIDTDPVTKNSIIVFHHKNKRIWQKLENKINFQFEGGTHISTINLWISGSTAATKQIKTLTFLLNSGEIISFPIDKKFTSFEKNDLRTKLKLTQEQINLFSTKTIQLIRMTFSNESIKDISIEALSAEYFCAYASLFAEALEQCGYKADNPAAKPVISSKTDTCFVYLMFDEANGFYKIGISNHPEYREHTLQSEKPTITLLKAKEYPSRAIAEAFESALHKTYESKRLRGEWFKLNADDVDILLKTLS